MPLDAGVSSLSSTSRARRESSEAFGFRMLDEMQLWRCLHCRGPIPVDPRRSYFYCSVACRIAEDAAVRARNQKRRRNPDPDPDEETDYQEELFV